MSTMEVSTAVDFFLKLWGTMANQGNWKMALNVEYVHVQKMSFSY